VREPSQIETVEEQNSFEAESAEVFSRIAFALRILDILRPNLDVTVYEAVRRLQIRRGRQWSPGGPAPWALVAIPPRASRYGIAYSLAELAGKAHHPYVVDLIAVAQSTS